MKDKPKEPIADASKTVAAGLGAPPQARFGDSQALLEAIMEHVPEGIAIADPCDLSVRMISKFGLDLLCHSKKQVEGASCMGLMKLGDVFHSDGAVRAKIEDLPLPRATLKGEVVTNEELVVRRRDGKKVNFLCSSGPIRDRQGNVIAGILLWRDITENKRKEEVLRTDNIAAHKDMEEELQAKSNRLQEVNSALKALLRQRDEDRKEFEEAVVTNIENLILPYVRRMKSGPLSSSQASLLEIVESHLNEITSKFGKTLAIEYRVLTPTEMRVAALVKEGKTSKEIAELLCISEKTASFHRNNIRAKLGLRGMGSNLRSHLLTLT
jgi:PAS domain S-box-containing protein